MELHLISTGTQTKDELVCILEKVHLYTDYIHLRERAFYFSDYVEVINKMISVGISLDKIIINDRLDVANSFNVKGIQLGSNSVSIETVRQTKSALQIGCSVHSSTEAKIKEIEGADYLLYGHVFSTASKPGLPPRGLTKLKDTVDNVSIPVIAIGGITPANVKYVKECGAKGIAVLSGVLLAEDPLEAAIHYAHAMMEVT